MYIISAGRAYPDRQFPPSHIAGSAIATPLADENGFSILAAAETGNGPILDARSIILYVYKIVGSELRLWLSIYK